MRNYVENIREEFRHLKDEEIISKGTYEIQAASFIANEDYIFGTPNQAYIDAELEWYKSMSLNVNDIELYYGLVPKIWERVSDQEGYINSNYGWCIYSNAIYMRSNDAIFGYMNDVAWQRFVLNELCEELSHAHDNIKPGDIHWHASSIHVYERHWDLIV